MLKYPNTFSLAALAVFCLLGLLASTGSLILSLATFGAGAFVDVLKNGNT